MEIGVNLCCLTPYNVVLCTLAKSGQSSDVVCSLEMIFRLASAQVGTGSRAGSELPKGEGFPFVYYTRGAWLEYNGHIWASLTVHCTDSSCRILLKIRHLHTGVLENANGSIHFGPKMGYFAIYFP